ncbi:MAG: glutathione S-transferase family protein, partial [Mariprofundaceae bacterium]
MITLFSNGSCPNSHRTRLVLSEKELPVNVIEADPESPPLKLMELNPYGKIPTMEDRGTVLFEASVINEYLDERYPHPPLKPGSPAERAQLRLSVMRIEQEIYPLFFELERAANKVEPLKSIQEYMKAIDVYLIRQSYFIGDVYTLADVTFAPILWRLVPRGLDTKNMPNLRAYMDRLFER